MHSCLDNPAVWGFGGAPDTRQDFYSEIDDLTADELKELAETALEPTVGPSCSSGTRLVSETELEDQGARGVLPVPDYHHLRCRLQLRENAPADRGSLHLHPALDIAGPARALLPGGQPRPVAGPSPLTSVSAPGS
jgi:hypothetical protein